MALWFISALIMLQKKWHVWGIKRDFSPRWAGMFPLILAADIKCDVQQKITCFRTSKFSHLPGWRSYCWWWQPQSVTFNVTNPRLFLWGRNVLECVVGDGKWFNQVHTGRLFAQPRGPGVSLSLLMMWEHLLLRADLCRMGISGIFCIISLCHVGLSAS